MKEDNFVQINLITKLSSYQIHNKQKLVQIRQKVQQPNK
jgi:hypothetical protein